MEQPKFENFQETEKLKSINLPAIELFSHPELSDKVWPKDIAENKEFNEQIENRKKLNDRLDKIISNLPQPDISLEDAISKEYITEQEVAELYNSLSELLEESNDYERVILYLPFEFIPNDTWEPKSAELDKAIKRFKYIYKFAWENMLTVHDVRANFNTGDILEEEVATGNLPRVVKAAHLSPQLIKKGIINIKEVLELIESRKDKILTHSFADTLPVLSDMGLISNEEIKRLNTNSDPYIKSKFELINLPLDKADDDLSIENFDLLSIQERINKELEEISKKDYHNITERRKKWLKSEEKRKIIENAGKNISAAILNHQLTEKSIDNFLSSQSSAEYKQALIEGIRQSIESLEKNDKDIAKKLYDEYSDLLTSIWHNNIPELQDSITKTFCRLNGLGIVSDEQLNSLGIQIPELSGSLSENLDSIKNEIDQLKDILCLIEDDAEISKYIYPIATIFGSRLKGYGSKDSDIDIGIFIRPETSFKDKDKVRSLIDKFFGDKIKNSEIKEIWLKDEKDTLSIQNFGKEDEKIGDNLWTHVLFGAAWEGNPSEVNELRGKVLVPYMQETDEKIQGANARDRYLESIERDILQYRLMHKGYEKYHPSYGGINTPHKDQIDGGSIFWDSGYRQKATQLFAQKVFIPKISK